MKKIFIFILSTVLLLNIQVVSAQTLNCNDLIANGSTGNRVRMLQTKLNRIMNCDLEIDGIVGPITESCIIKFQQKYNLIVDGIAGPQTCTKLNSLYSQSMNTKYIVITGNKVNVRNGASLTPDSIITTVNQGKVLKFYGTKTVDGITWYIIHVKQNDKTINGYIHSDYAQKTVVLLNLTTQRLTYYNNGKLILNNAVVTGQKGTYDTPKGKYTINPANKLDSKLLHEINSNGTIYKEYVSYWMPFTERNQIGIHGVNWRSADEFNSYTYLTDGSHGTINMKLEDAQRLYKFITKETNVIITD